MAVSTLEERMASVEEELERVKARLASQEHQKLAGWERILGRLPIATDSKRRYALAVNTASCSDRRTIRTPPDGAAGFRSHEFLQRGGAESIAIARRLRQVPPDDVATTIVSFEEQAKGWLARLSRAATTERLQSDYGELKKLLRNYCDIAVVEFDAEAAIVYARLQTLRLRIGTMDLKIAAIVLANDATLLTRNVRDFARAPTCASKIGLHKALRAYHRSAVRFACNGECPKHRFLRTPDGEYGLNYLCAGYKHFFRHIDPHMRTITALLNAGRAPAEIVDLLARSDRQRTLKTAGRNDPCPCGSGRKFKQCCLGRR